MRFPDTSQYNDIIGLPHRVSSRYPRMPLADRAAQFSPFAALTGHGALIEETERLTDDWAAPHEDRIEELNGRLQMLRDWVGEPPDVTITYFQPDARKAGGSYISCTGCVARYDPIGGSLTMKDGTSIAIQTIVEIEGQVFDPIQDL